MHPFKEAVRAETRRQFFGRTARGIGGLALANLLADEAFALPGQAPAAAGGAAGACRTSRPRRSAASTCT